MFERFWRCSGDYLCFGEVLLEEKREEVLTFFYLLLFEALKDVGEVFFENVQLFF